MNELEQQTFTDGFRVALLGVCASAHRNVLAFEAVLFDGGREIDRYRREEPFFGPAPDIAIALRRHIHRVLAPPHVLAVYGHGWQDLLKQCLANLVDELRLLDLQRTAAALSGNLSARAGVEDLAQAFDIDATMISEEGLFSPFHEQLLWAVVHRAGERGWHWPQLLECARNTQAGISFARYDFTQENLLSVPQVPGVYIMRDAQARPLYVGKSVNLARRLSEYFQPTLQVPQKIELIRDRMRNFEYHVVGSELEALLLENDLIQELAPEVNTQRRITMGASRHAPPSSSLVIICSSADPKRQELFFFGTPERAIQLSVRRGHAPLTSLERLIRYYTGQLHTVRRTRAMHDWGKAGCEICRRYHARLRPEIAWIELNSHLPAEEQAAAILEAGDTAALTNEPAEFRC